MCKILANNLRLVIDKEKPMNLIIVLKNTSIVDIRTYELKNSNSYHTVTVYVHLYSISVLYLNRVYPCSTRMYRTTDMYVWTVL